MRSTVWLLMGLPGALLAGPAAAQVFKCTVGGATVYQALPCAAAGGTGQAVKLHVAPAVAPVAPATQPTPAPPKAEPSPEPATPPAPPVRHLVEGEASMPWGAATQTPHAAAMG